MTREALHIKGMPEDTACEVHAWAVEDFRTRLVPLMRERHGKGGVNVCRDCIDRAHAGLQTRLRTPQGATDR